MKLLLRWVSALLLWSFIIRQCYYYYARTPSDEGIFGFGESSNANLLLGVLLGSLASGIFPLSDFLRDLLLFRIDGTTLPSTTSQSSVTPHEEGEVVFVKSYGVDHKLLNIECKTTWLNLGYWKTATSFVEACESLADLVGDAARLGVGDVALDVGNGCGDSSVYWTKKHQLAELVGITPEVVQNQIAREKVKASKLESTIKLYIGDAVKLDEVLQKHWRESRRSETGVVQLFDRVLCLDCAYHFKTRRQFLQQAHKSLKSGGRIALSDLTLGAGYDRYNGILKPFVLPVLAKLTGVPMENLVRLREYEASFIESGFRNVRVETIEEFVFPKLAAFIDCHHKNFRDFVKPHLWIQYRVMAYVFNFISRHQLLHYVITSAEK
eukprot:TRINITY_DN4622_c0_g1_i2.p1 TRINITY_DN4622_c0_g1~~TRINITY_DN4622_c0_g1_i2.p1  ORF type:complete len:381 (+),score=60.65 TRINITY_DN4622_c0_g1_i2:201-1343(+)